MPTKKKPTASRSRSTRKPKPTGERKDTYQIITDKLVEALDRGEIPWRQTWKGGEDGIPRSMSTGKPYRGINVFLLTVLGQQYSSPYWLTYKQAQDLGGNVRKGEHGVQVVFWAPFGVKDENGQPVLDAKGRQRQSFMLRRYTVFNFEQTEGVYVAPRFQPKDAGELPGGDAIDAEAADAAIGIFTAYTEREGIRVGNGGAKAYYKPATDEIRLPRREAFECAEDYAATALHEATHSTGATTRLNRPGITEVDGFGSHQYADEELVAEFGASFLCGIAGVERTEQIENSAAYIAAWKKRCQEDPKLLVWAAQRAQKAADFVLDAKPSGTGDADESAEG